MSHHVATVGTFDGVHRGHRAIFDTMRSEACRTVPAAFVVNPHPLSVLRMQAPALLTDIDTRRHLIEDCGIAFHELKFDRDTAALTARQFMQMLANDHGIDTLVMGHDNNFGSDRLRGADVYRTLGAETGIKVVTVPPLLTDSSQIISSSAIRSLLSCGDVVAANDMLGRMYSISGTVEKGMQLGRTIGFPTANFVTENTMQIPSDGVYAGYAAFSGDKTPARAVINIGTAPTVRSDGHVKTEVHLLDGTHTDLYGKKITVFFKQKLRDEQRFESIEQLRLQLNDDRNTAAAILR